MIKNYVAFDLETTGLNAESDFIIEIGALKVIDGKVCERFIEFVKPPMSIPRHITEITGITNEMVSNAREIKDVVRDFVAFCEDFILVGHNISFDYKFTKNSSITMRRTTTPKTAPRNLPPRRAQWPQTPTRALHTA